MILWDCCVFFPENAYKMADVIKIIFFRQFLNDHPSFHKFGNSITETAGKFIFSKSTARYFTE